MIKISPKAVVFDFDGTLAKLSIDFLYMRKAVLNLISEYGVSPDGLEGFFVLEMIEAGRNLISGAYPEREPDFLKEANILTKNIEVEGAKKGGLFEGTTEMLEELRKRNIKTGIVTRNCSNAVRAIFPDVDSFCDALITREYAGRIKPHPQHLETVLEMLEADPAESVMTGDHPMDISMGKDAGTYTIGVLTGCSEKGPLCEAGADIVLDKATQIVELI